MQVRVRTVKPEQETTGWAAGARDQVQWDAVGKIIDASNSHGSCYRVQHADSSTAWYEARELQLI